MHRVFIWQMAWQHVCMSRFWPEVAHTLETAGCGTHNSWDCSICECSREMALKIARQSQIPCRKIRSSLKNQSQKQPKSEKSVQRTLGLGLAIPIFLIIWLLRAVYSANHRAPNWSPSPATGQNPQNTYRTLIWILRRERRAPISWAEGGGKKPLTAQRRSRHTFSHRTPGSKSPPPFEVNSEGSVGSGLRSVGKRAT